MAAANRIPGVVARGTEAIRAAANQLEPAAGDAREWLSDHPCPDSALGEQFAAAFDAFIALADECAVAATSIPGYVSHALDERAGQTVAGLMTAMYAIRSAER
jgi:hypothetical protein